MQVTDLAIPGVKLITPVRHGDSRGFFSEVYNAVTLAELASIDLPFVQDNHAFSTGRGVVRGLHFQAAPFAQDKLLRVVRGAILDVAVDLRHGSPTFGRHVTAEISADNWTQIWVPKGCAHGYCTLTDEAEVLYKVTAAYSPAHDKGLLWNDPALAIAWPVAAVDAVVSDKDRAQPLLAELPRYFVYDG